MASNSSVVHAYFAKLGLEPELADVYLALHAHGPQSLLQLARNAKVERTRLYRLLDALIDSQLLEIETHYKRKMYKAAPLNNLQVVLSRKEQELQDLQADLQLLQATFQTQPAAGAQTRIQLYRGPEGMKQMFWNQTKTQTENLSVLFENMQNRTNLAFFERWVKQCNQQQLRFRSLVSDHFLLTQQNWYQEHDNEKLQHWKGRHIPNNIFPITHSTVTYNDVVAYYNWQGGEIFGIEIYNQEIADAQRHVFEMLWRQSSPIKGHGETA